MTFLIVIVVLFALMWLLMVRPQKRRQIGQLQMQNSLRVGDEVITAGGLHAYIRRLDDEVLTVEIAPGVEARLDRRAVAGVVRDEDQPEEQEEPEEEVDEADEPAELPQGEAEPISRGEA